MGICASFDVLSFHFLSFSFGLYFLPAFFFLSFFIPLFLPFFSFAFCLTIPGPTAPYHLLVELGAKLHIAVYRNT